MVVAAGAPAAGDGMGEGLAAAPGVLAAVAVLATSGVIAPAGVLVPATVPTAVGADDVGTGLLVAADARPVVGGAPTGVATLASGRSLADEPADWPSKIVTA